MTFRFDSLGRLAFATAWALGVVTTSLAQSLPPERSPGHRPDDYWSSALSERGIQLSGAYTGDALGNVSGGLRRGWVYQGKAELTVLADLAKIAGWEGARLHVHGFNIHNTGRMRRDYVGGVNTIAAIEAEHSTRLSELWLEQDFADGTANVRFGQLAADVEFFFSALSFLFLQSDWATIAALGMPSGGPAYPLSTPGVRLRLDPSADASVLLALYNGDPAGPGAGDEQARNRHGLNFRVSDPALFMAELQLRANQAQDSSRLARAVKLGLWAHRGTFQDQRLADDGLVLADPASGGRPAPRRHNRGMYAVVEQQLYRPAGGSAESGVSAFGRVAGSSSDRNAVDFFFDAGIVFAGMVDHRPADRFGASFMYSRFSDAARGADHDRIAFSGQAGVVRDYEANLELTYSAQITKDWSLQPMLALVRHPNGDPSRNVTVTGMRSFVKF